MKTKDIEIAGNRYQIGQFKARDGSFILMQLLTKMLPSFVESAFQKEGAALGASRPALSEDEFAAVQGHALAVCRRYESNVPMPVFVRPDTFAIKELEYDTTTVMALTVNALLFNLSPFFQDGGLTQILESIPGLAPTSPNSQT